MCDGSGLTRRGRVAEDGEGIGEKSTSEEKEDKIRNARKAQVIRIRTVCKRRRRILVCASSF